MLDTILSAIPDLLRGLGFTIKFSVLGLICALIIGTLAGLGKLSKRRITRGIANCYIEIFRGTPLLAQILFIYSGLPMIFPIYEWVSGEWYLLISAVAALGLNEGAYIAEIVRAGILSIDKGQWSAGFSLGMTRRQILRYVILPQAFKQMIPPLINQTGQTIKDTSLLAVISGAELVYTGQVIIANTFMAFQFWLIIAALYFIMIYSLTRFSVYLERRFDTSYR